METKFYSFISYFISGGLICDCFNWLNQYAAACGVILGVLTFLLNWYYQAKNSKRLENQKANK